MTQPNETPAPESKAPLPSEVTADVAPPSAASHPEGTRKGHSNGLKVHSITFGLIALVVLVALGVTLLVIGDGMM